MVGGEAAAGSADLDDCLLSRRERREAVVTGVVDCIGDTGAVFCAGGWYG